MQPLRDHVRDPITPLQRAFDHQQAGFERAAALRREYLRPQDDIDDAGLILQRSEHHARGGGRLLHVRHQASDPHAAAVGEALQIAAAAKAAASERRAQQRQRVAAGGQAEVPIIGEDILALGRCRQRGRRLTGRQAGDAGQAAVRRPAPASWRRGGASLRCRQRTGGRQRLDRAPRQLGARGEFIDAGERCRARVGHDALGIGARQAAHQP